MPEFQALHFKAPDGLALYARRYDPPSPSGKAPVVCLHGLTRNSKDFEDVAPAIAAQGRMVIVPDVRGRGRSARDPNPGNYNPGVYAGDLAALRAHLDLGSFIAIGTSMGGLISMAFNAANPGALAGLVLNDIGPVIEEAGLERIRSYVGGGGPFATWTDAIAAVQANNSDAFPGVTDAGFWLAFARRQCVQGEDGLIRFDYDPAIATALRDNPGQPAPDLWPLFEALEKLPVLVVRGALSDILSAGTVEAMHARNAGLKDVTVPGVGHAPMLTEPEALDALTGFLESVD
ncbi:MAG: alpha/beta hydrolase [Maricaulaceae bacterium]|nr:alpha/beta hydrolase [Maricaulaceae bacterium]